MPASPMAKLTLAQAAARYLETVDDRSASASFESHTRRSFEFALRKFLEVVERRTKMKADELPVAGVDPEWTRPFIDWLKRQRIAPATERLRLVAVQGF